MHSDKDICDIFRLMGLLSAEERKPFEVMSTPRIPDDSEQPYLFIRTDSVSSRMESEKEDAKLERDS